MKKEPESFADFIQGDMVSTRNLDIAQMKNGLYVLPGVRRFVSAVHTDKDFDDTVKALDAACRAVK
jgi:glutamate-1-semialdehyde aminotransferase